MITRFGTYYEDAQAKDAAKHQFPWLVSFLANNVDVSLMTYLLRGNCALIRSGIGMRSIIKSDETLKTVAVII